MNIQVNGREVFDSWRIKRALRTFFCHHDWMKHSHYGLASMAHCFEEEERLLRTCRKCYKYEFLGYGRKVPFAAYPREAG